MIKIEFTITAEMTDEQERELREEWGEFAAIRRKWVNDALREFISESERVSPPDIPKEFHAINGAVVRWEAEE